MKRSILSLALAAAMACTLAVPALGAAEPAADARLAAVTARVKQILDLDTAAYPEFHGDLAEEPLAAAWDLEWSGGGKPSISVRAAETGKILSFQTDLSGGVRPSSGGIPSFPAGNREAARSAALAFLKRVLDANESVVLEDQGGDRLDTTAYRFRGSILVNGLPAGQSCSVAVRCGDNQVVSFYRDELSFSVIGGVPSDKPAVLSDAAGRTLRDTLTLRLEYVLPEPGAKKAVLRYLPENRDEYYVDAASGELVDLTELAREVDRGGGTAGVLSNAAMDAMEKSAAPSPAELAGAAQMEGV